MSEYDNTNTGRLFRNGDDWTIVQTGKIDIEGNERRVIGVKRNNRNGEPIIEIYTSLGTLKQAEKRNDKSPDAMGIVENLATVDTKRVFARKMTSKGGSDYVFLSFADLVSEQGTEQDAAPADNDLNDEIPF